jgi:hypothetical protein
MVGILPGGGIVDDRWDFMNTWCFLGMGKVEVEDRWETDGRPVGTRKMHNGRIKACSFLK